MDRELNIFVGRSHTDFATEVCRHVGVPLGMPSGTQPFDGASHHDRCTEVRISGTNYGCAAILPLCALR